MTKKLVLFAWNLSTLAVEMSITNIDLLEAESIYFPVNRVEIGYFHRKAFQLQGNKNQVIYHKWCSFSKLKFIIL